jgi:hypothetical protein
VYPRLLLLAALLVHPAIIFAKSQPKNQRTSNQVRLKQFIQFVLKRGHDWLLFGDRRGPIFGFTVAGVPSKALSNDDYAGKSVHPERMCNVVVDADGKPVCLILQLGLDFPRLRQSKDWNFRLNLNGNLENAFSGVGDSDATGKPIPGSARDRQEDVTDPETQERAAAELNYWLKTVNDMIKKDAGSRKP